MGHWDIWYTTKCYWGCKYTPPSCKDPEGAFDPFKKVNLMKKCAIVYPFLHGLQWSNFVQIIIRKNLYRPQENSVFSPLG